MSVPAFTQLSLTCSEKDGRASKVFVVGDEQGSRSLECPLEPF